MSWKSIAVRGLVFGLLTLPGLVRADGDFRGVLDEPQSHAVQDRIFEGRVYGLLEQKTGAVSRYVQVTRFGNILVITGEVAEAAHATVIDGLVLEAAGIKRENNSVAGVVPKKDRDCGGRPVTGNAKRRMIVAGNRDCSSLRGDESAGVKGKVYNHLAVGAPDPSMKVAAADLLRAAAVLELVDAGYTQVLDRAAMRLVVQDGIFYVLGHPGEVERKRIRAVLISFPGVKDVRFYTE